MTTTRTCPQCADARLEETDDYDDAAFYCPSCSYEVPRERASDQTVRDHIADTARALAALYGEAQADPKARVHYVDAIADAARACGPQVYAAWCALVTGDAGREVGNG